ncbi:hypothetical protein D3C76_1068780 [compost metagenome]
MLGRRVGADVQTIVFRAVEPVALGIGIGAEVGLAQPRGFRHHAFGVGDRLVEPGAALPQLVVVSDALGRIADVQHRVPLPVRPVSGAGKALGEGVGLGDQFADLCTLFQGLALGIGRVERFVLFDAQAGEHGHVEAIPLVDRFFLDDLVQALPVRHAPWLGAGPGFAAGGEQFGLAGLATFGVGVHPELLDQRLALGGVGVEHAKTHQHIHGVRLGQVILARIGRWLGARGQHQVFAALAFVRAGLAHVDDCPLPEIANTACGGARG